MNRIDTMGSTNHTLRESLRSFIRRGGWDLRRYPAAPDQRTLPFLRRRWLSDLKVTLVADVGANTGQYATEVREAGYSGRIVSFEPLGSAFANLKSASNGDPRWDARRVAVGSDAGELTINVSANTESSSVLAMCARHSNAAPESTYVSVERVPVVRLDDDLLPELAENAVVWLKADVQGYEWPVLDGSPGLIARAAGVEIELSVVPLYEGQPLLHESVAKLAGLGFELAALEEVFHEPQTGRTLQYAGVFLRPPLRDSTPSQE